MKSSRYFIITVLAILLSACAEQSSPTASTPDTSVVEAANKATMAGLYEVFNTGDLANVDSLMITDVIEHQMMPGIEATGSEAFRQIVQQMREAFPDLRMVADEMVAEGNFVATRFTMSGTNTGTFMGSPATGRSFEVSGLDLVRFESGKAAEHWGYQDDMSFMVQLGMMPAEGAPASTEPAAAAPAQVEAPPPVEAPAEPAAETPPIE